ncbi:SH3 domain-containing protein [Primorskyibacter sp. S187A]|uniref:SH3 domain-containing protein n=1 Tax=Primorskyibacter sp. S187A TaxID=3415130 RepID=UPI003C7EAD4B
MTATAETTSASASAGGAGMGATLFIGLSVLALITQGDPEIIYANPQVTMADVRLDEAQEALPASVEMVAPKPVGFEDRAVALAAVDEMAPLAPPVVQEIRTVAQAPGALRAQVQLAQIGAAPSPDRLIFTAPDRWPATAPLAQPTSRATSPGLDPGATPVPAPLMARLTGDFVRLRVAPNVGAAEIGSFDTGTLVTVLEQEGAWWRLSIAGQEGWMFARYLEPL